MRLNIFTLDQHARCTILSGNRLSNTTEQYEFVCTLDCTKGSVQRPVAHSGAVVLQCVQMLQVWSCGENGQERDARGELARKALEKKY